MEKRYLIINLNGRNVGAFEGVNPETIVDDGNCLSFTSSEGSFEYCKGEDGIYRCDDNPIKFDSYEVMGRRAVNRRLPSGSVKDVDRHLDGDDLSHLHESVEEVNELPEKLKLYFDLYPIGEDPYDEADPEYVEEMVRDLEDTLDNGTRVIGVIHAKSEDYGGEDNGDFFCSDGNAYLGIGQGNAIRWYPKSVDDLLQDFGGNSNLNNYDESLNEEALPSETYTAEKAFKTFQILVGKFSEDITPIYNDLQAVSPEEYEKFLDLIRADEFYGEAMVEVITNISGE